MLKFEIGDKVRPNGTQRTSLAAMNRLEAECQIAADNSIKDTRKPSVLVDIDQVLCHARYTPGPAGFIWKEFIKADLETRERIEPGILLVTKLVASGLYPVFLTARPEFMRGQTQQMLSEYGFNSGALYMASNASSESATGEDYRYHQMVEKNRIISEEGLMTYFHFHFAIDDQEDNINMYRIWGIPALKAVFGN